MLKLFVLYPQPVDAEKFDKDYQAHIRLFHEKMGIPESVKPYKIAKIVPSPMGLPQFYLMFSMPFNSPEELQAALASPAMQEVAADAQRISTGGPLVILIGNED
jgi:uncharacterized protein (TIGR02118 family)